MLRICVARSAAACDFCIGGCESGPEVWTGLWRQLVRNSVGNKCGICVQPCLTSLARPLVDESERITDGLEIIAEIKNGIWKRAN
jgi:hypothetical protein